MKSGLILFNKSAGITSFDSLRDIKRALGTGKVGHTGTLDKFAQGLMIVLVGKSLRLSQWFTHCDKKYKGRICFGKETDTLDPEGEVIAEAALPSRESVEKVLSQFTGEIMQAPPLYSAIHIDGQRASNLARAGQSPQMKKRPVTVYKLELLSWEPPFADIFVHCSSGTYIRSLTRDIALAAGSRAYLNELVRTQIAGFNLDFFHAEAQKSRERREERGEEGAADIKVLPIDKSVISALGMPWFEVSLQEAGNIFHGKPLNQIFENKPLFPPASSSSLCELSVKSSLNNAAAVFEGETLVAIVEKEGSKWKYGCVLNNLGDTA